MIERNDIHYIRRGRFVSKSLAHSCVLPSLADRLGVHLLQWVRTAGIIIHRLCVEHYTLLLFKTAKTKTLQLTADEQLLLLSNFRDRVAPTPLARRQRTAHSIVIYIIR